MTRQITLIWALCCLFFSTVNGQYYSLSFDGEDDMLELGSISGNGVRTIQLWFQPRADYDEMNPFPATILYRDSPNQQGEFGLYIGPSNWAGQEGKLVFSRNYGSQRELIVSNANSWQAGRWYHVIAYIDPNSGMQMFINGVLQNDVNNSNVPTDTRGEKVTIGAWGTRGFRSFEGQIDDVSLMGRMLTAQERNQYLQRDASGAFVYSGTITHLAFNEGSGSVTADLTNQTMISIDSSQWRTSGSTIRLDNAHSSIDLGLDVGNGIRSIDMWFRPAIKIDDNLSDPAALIYREAPNGRNEMGLYFGPSDWNGQEGRLVFSIADEVGTIHRVVSDNDRWEPTQWYHVVATIDPSNGMKLYIDGVVQTDNNPFTNATAFLEHPTVIGKWGYKDIRYYQGLVDDVRVWKRTLSEDEILFYNCGEEIDSSGLAAYYTFNDAGDSTLTDLSGYENHISLSTADKWEESRTCPQTAEFMVTTSIPDSPILKQEKLTIQPNPVTTDTKIFFPNFNYREWRLQLYNNLGQLLQQESGNGSVIHFTPKGHSSGIYYLRVKDQATSEEFVEKMIIR